MEGYCFYHRISIPPLQVREALSGGAGGTGDMEGKLKKQLPVRTQMVWYLLATVLILVAGGLRALDRGMYNSFLSVWLQLLRHMIHIGLLIGWMISIQSRILQRPVRRYLLAIGGMLSFWLFVRASKWMLFAHDSQMNRYCWYSYYIPMVLVPLLAGMLLPHIGQSERYRPGKRRRFWYIPAVALIGLVLTNDLHQLIFRFPDGIVFFRTGIRTRSDILSFLPGACCGGFILS